MMVSPSLKSPCLAKSNVGMRPTMHTRVGDEVKKGHKFFVDKRTQVLYLLLQQAVKLLKWTGK